MENTSYNKQKFFALYWGQEVQKVFMSHSEPICKVGYYLYDNNINKDYLELKPLSAISDEDAIHIAVFAGWNNGSHKWATLIREGKLIANEGRDSTVDEIGLLEYTNISDYLRSKSYALPYMSLSVEQQIEYGWVKLTSNK